jgi:uncharacterized protein
VTAAVHCSVPRVGANCLHRTKQAPPRLACEHPAPPAGHATPQSRRCAGAHCPAGRRFHSRQARFGSAWEIIRARGAEPLKVGLISDTHGLLRDEAIRGLAGVDLIIHAGDIGGTQVLAGLGDVAPVKAVRGNNDSGSWAAGIPEELDLRLAGSTIHVLHDVKTLRDPEHRPGRSRPRIIIAGHSHRPAITSRDGSLFINPGSAGPRRFSLPVTIALLELGKGEPRARICPIL